MPATMDHSHVPKRAVQAGLYTPGEEILPVPLKPGQKQLHSNGLYTAETSYAKSQEPTLLQERGHESEYTKHLAKTTVPEDYRNPVKPMKKAVLARTGEDSEKTGGSHWVSEYRAKSSEGASRMQTPRMTAEHILAGRAGYMPVSCMSRAQDTSLYLTDFGRHGSNPRDSIAAQDTKLPVFKSGLTAGTPRGTSHIPGYQGFLPSYPGFSEPLLRVAEGEFVRSTDKTNISQTYKKNVVGYAGHEPTAVVNDFGARKPTTLTVMGRDFQGHTKGAMR
eukprot:TRINITY_DN14285_c0_g1_i1.p1 TRINITY_DN14285_c0_g1~~TRINITY_DN14285_c0_g1_i1.p1  ORF type:complete len:277 (-),score=26.97 TRINITY_DN14285_c0_g1_i1:445-1275(-)